MLAVAYSLCNSFSEIYTMTLRNLARLGLALLLLTGLLAGGVKAHATAPAAFIALS
jgi:hypothetical protein